MGAVKDYHVVCGQSCIKTEHCPCLDQRGGKQTHVQRTIGWIGHIPPRSWGRKEWAGELPRGHEQLQTSAVLISAVVNRGRQRSAGPSCELAQLACHPGGRRGQTGNADLGCDIRYLQMTWPFPRSPEDPSCTCGLPHPSQWNEQGREPQRGQKYHGVPWGPLGTAVADQSRAHPFPGESQVGDIRRPRSGTPACHQLSSGWKVPWLDFLSGALFCAGLAAHRPQPRAEGRHLSEARPCTACATETGPGPETRPQAGPRDSTFGLRLALPGQGFILLASLCGEHVCQEVLDGSGVWGADEEWTRDSPGSGTPDIL